MEQDEQQDRGADSSVVLKYLIHMLDVNGSCSQNLWTSGRFFLPYAASYSQEMA